VGDREAVPSAAGLLAADHLAAVLLVAHRLDLEAAVLRVAIAPEALIPAIPTAVLAMDTRLGIRLDTHLAIVALAQGAVSGLP
jgi:hypothetical protein